MLIIMIIINTQLCSINYSHYGTFPGQSEQNRNKRKEIERFDWFIKRIQTRAAFGWLSQRSAGRKLHAPRTF